MRPSLARAGRRLRFAGPALTISAILALIPYPTCIARLAFGVPCPACGLTRAALALLRLDLAAATHFHPLALPLAFTVVGVLVAAFVMEDATWKRFGAYVSGGCALALIVVWGARFLGAFGGPVL